MSTYYTSSRISLFTNYQNQNEVVTIPITVYRASRAPFPVLTATGSRKSRKHSLPKCKAAFSPKSDNL